MKLFNTIMSKIFGSGSSAPTSAPASGTTQPATASSPSAANAPAPAGAPGSKPASQPVDVAAVLNGLAAKNSEKLDWKRSIVDLMKLVGMDSDLGSRKELARELDYSGDLNDSATMNVWLHKQVLKKLGENGGKVPAELLD